MDVRPLALEGAVEITPRRFVDDRGFFTESWSRDGFAAHGLSFDFVQDNHSLSREAGTLRGLHYQAPPMAQDKLVRCTRGAIRDVAVDIRRGSPTFGAWVAVELSAENGRQLLVPKGFLHGFLTLTPDAEVQYKCSGYYQRAAEGSVRWDDPEIGIVWPIDQPTTSERDRQAMSLSTYRERPAFVWGQI